jgi:cardiolipin synthase
LKGGHELRLLQGGQDFFPALIEAIDNAGQEVRLETYIFHFDRSGEKVAQALERAAQRGVAVFLVMDGIGTPALPAGWEQRFARSGVQWHRFLPLGRFGLFMPVRWRRMHRKLCVVDGALAFCGGINIIDDWVDADTGALQSPRYDFALGVRGPLVADVYHTMVQFWIRLEATQQLENLEFQEARNTLRSAQVASKNLPATGPAAAHPTRSAHAGLVLRDNVHNRTRIEQTYRKAIAGARHEIVLANAYFLPGRKMRRTLLLAAQRGVRVRLLLQGRYESFLQYHGARAMYAELMAGGVEIFEYRAGFLHAKVAVVDAGWATVGSSNLDPLSLLLAREANVVVQDKAFCTDMARRLGDVLNQTAVRLDPAEFDRRAWSQRLRDRLAFALVKTLLFLTGRRY